MATEIENLRTRELKTRLRDMPLIELLQMMEAAVEFLEVVESIAREKMN